MKKVTDPNGNAVTFGPSGILHSDGTGIVFTRDGSTAYVLNEDLSVAKVDRGTQRVVSTLAAPAL